MKYMAYKIQGVDSYIFLTKTPKKDGYIGITD